MKSGPESELLDRYMERLRAAGRGLGISAAEIRELPESRKPDAGQRRQAEAAEIMAIAGAGAHCVALDETGKSFSSTEIAGLLRNGLDNGQPAIHLLIGGPDGHGEEVLKKAAVRLSFGRASWPHQLVRVMLAEQLYRAVTILSGHPYHRG
jgi:23S rRNA (pseudouridine1915-N3)-methyltransferase